jgi:hypothetical protein
MKKRTVCFGWTKSFQRRIAAAFDLMRAGKPKAAGRVIADVKAGHRERIIKLRGAK